MKLLFHLIVCTCVCNFGVAQETNVPLNLTIVSHLGAGFFAELNKVVDNILHFHPIGLSGVKVDWSQEFFPYKDDPFANGWELYFEPIQGAWDNSCHEVVSKEYYHEVHDFRCVEHWIHYRESFPYRLKVHNVLCQFIHIKPHILHKVSEFFDKHMKEAFCLGVHVRYGADHGVEAPAGIPTLDDYIQATKEVLAAVTSSRKRIYLATDSHYVVYRFLQEFPHELLYIDAQRANDNETPHLIYTDPGYWQTHKQEWHQKKPGYFGGESALIDCLLLSKCHAFIHSTSNVASFVTYFNPYIESIFLPKNTPYWPCRFRP